MKFSSLSREGVFMGLSAVLIAGMLFSRALLSISTILLVVFLLSSVPVRELWRRFYLQPYALALTALAVVPLISVCWSEDSTQWGSKMRDKLPFLLVPFAFTAADFLKRPHRIMLLKWLVGISLLTALVVLGNLALNYATILQQMKGGTPIPAPNGHIRFSLQLCFAAFASLYLASSAAHRKWIWYAAFGLLSGALFVLSTRSGILAWAIGLPVYLMVQMPAGMRVRALLFSLLLGPLLTAFFFYMFPPFRQRMEYMRYDFQQWRAGKIENTSDGMRWYSIQNGWELFKENPCLGVGLGDLERETRSKAVQIPGQPFEASVWRIPHNQWVYLMASQGLLGLLVFAGAFALVFLFGAATSGPLWWVLHVLLFTSFLTEYTIEEQVGAALYWYWVLLLKKTD